MESEGGEMECEEGRDGMGRGHEPTRRGSGFPLRALRARGHPQCSADIQKPSSVPCPPPPIPAAGHRSEADTIGVAAPHTACPRTSRARARAFCIAGVRKYSGGVQEESREVERRATSRPGGQPFAASYPAQSSRQILRQTTEDRCQCPRLKPGGRHASINACRCKDASKEVRTRVASMCALSSQAACQTEEPVDRQNNRREDFHETGKSAQSGAL